MKRALGCAIAVGWVVSVALCGEEGGQAVSPARVLAAALAHAERLGYKRAPAQEQPEFTATDAERGRGFAVFARNVNLPVYPESVPEAEERVDGVYAYGAPGETVSAQVAVRALAPLAGVRVRATDLRGPGDARVLGEGIRCRWVEYAPIRAWGGRRGRVGRAGREGPVRAGQTCRVVPLRIRSMPASGGLDLPADWTQAYWLTINLPATAAPGRYEGQVEVLVAGEGRFRLPLVVTLLPIRLSEPTSMLFGAFLMVGGLPDGPDVHTVAQLKDLAERGIQGILWFWGHYGLAVRRVDGQLKMDFAYLDLYMDRVREAGLKGPVVLALGNDSRGHLEQAIAEIWDLPLRRRTERPERAADRLFAVATLDCPELDALYVEAIRQLLEHAREKGWPEIVLLPYDEPTERLKAEYIHRAGLLKKHFPEVRIYGVVMGDVPDLPWLGAVSDVLVTNGGPEAVRAYAKEQGKGFWTYGGRCQAGEPFGRARVEYGLRPWALGTEGHWFWAYNWRVGDPLDEFDGERGDAAWVVAYPPEGRLEACVPSPAFEGMRAGVDDVRYLEALAALLDGLPPRTAQRYRERLDQLRGEINRLGRQVGPETLKPPTVPFPTGPTTGYEAIRLSLIQMILEVQSLDERR